MDLLIRLKILERLYAIYDEFASNLDVACQKYCAHCCTRNVILTTLEGHLIMDYLKSHRISGWLQAIKSTLHKKRFHPKTTVNTIAEYCLENKSLPEEEIHWKWGPCPLLRENECMLYPVRPFACRCMVSNRNCRETGSAETDDFVITVNTAFLQTIEHLDSDGCSGNLTNILLCLATEKTRHAYRTKWPTCEDWELIPNQAIKVLMIPPEHRKKIEPLLQKIRRIHL